MIKDRTTACSIGRIVYYNKIDYEDFTCKLCISGTPQTRGRAVLTTAGQGAEGIIWTTLEQNIGLIAANLTPLGKFSRLVYEKILASSSIQYIIARSGGSASEKLSDNQAPTIGAVRPKRSKDSDFELMRTENYDDLS